ncbi:NAD(P)/FAD-dependent oxidoreductase [Limoniibacter endophyticus]|uniref:Dehydrogenase n=1 Tax=Limoniibacter endophyticus TaxID=1565040 RepID=A0A8J3DII4_9HYPH|nr:NAD(P)/FAD-dependent oxidoreductase [Limoniibacter endophyticus]GHC70568.1 dehydrogenase [Limoniibacter endophyticus]
MDKIECVVAGAGVVGLAIAREMALRGKEVMIFEAANMIGSETSSRNSEVIHAGIYYPKGSLKAQLCVQGKEMLYSYAKDRGIPHKRCGKLIVATEQEQIGTLDAIQQKALANGVEDLKILTKGQAKALEPSLSCEAALLSPSTGIIDSHVLMQTLEGDLENAGGIVALSTCIVSGKIVENGVVLLTKNRDTGEEFEILAENFVNAAGLGAQSIAHSIEGFNATSIPPFYMAKGNYFSANGRNIFSHLIYPVPQEGGLGVHLTLDLDGNMRFGPDVEWIQTIDYRVDAGRADIFYEEIRRYWPNLKDDALLPSYSGIRPKLVPEGTVAADFAIHGSDMHGALGQVHLYGIESPGLTSSLAIAKLVANKLATSIA